jgi:hypothetical protein
MRLFGTILKPFGLTDRKFASPPSLMQPSDAPFRDVFHRFFASSGRALQESTGPSAVGNPGSLPVAIIVTEHVASARSPVNMIDRVDDTRSPRR